MGVRSCSEPGGLGQPTARSEDSLMRLTPIQGLLKNLKGEIPAHMRREFLPKDVAYEKLKSMTGQDFGYDSIAWQKWIHEQEEAGVKFRIGTER